MPSGRRRKPICRMSQASPSETIREYLNNSPVEVSCIWKKTRKYIRATGHKPVVFMDCLPLVRPSCKGTDGMPETRRLNEAMISLTGLAVTCGVPVVALLPFRWGEPVTLYEFAGHGEAADLPRVLLSLQAAGADRKEEESDGEYTGRIGLLEQEYAEKVRRHEPASYELRCVKNDFGTTFSVPVKHVAAYGYFEQAGEAEDYSEY